MDTIDNAPDRKPLDGVVKHLWARQAIGPRGPPQTDRDRDCHALVGVVNEDVAPHQGAKKKFVAGWSRAPIPAPMTEEEY